MRQRQRSARKKTRHPSKGGMRAKVANRPERVTSELGGRKLVRVWKLCCQRWGMTSDGELGGLWELGRRSSTAEQHSAVDWESEVLKVQTTANYLPATSLGTAFSLSSGYFIFRMKMLYLW